MPDTSKDIVKTESKVKPRNKKGFREPTSLHVDPKLWQEVRVMAVLKNVSVTEYFEDALRRKLDADNLEAGRQGYQVGHGGMYIPPPPAPSQPQPLRQQLSSNIDESVDAFMELTEKIVMPGESYEEEEVTAERERKEKKQVLPLQQPQPQSQQQQQEELYKLKDEKWTIKDEDRRISVLQKFIGKIAKEHRINGEEAMKLIMKQKDLLKRAADEIGTDDEAYIYYMLKDKIDAYEKIREYKKIREREIEIEKKMKAKEKPKEKEKKVVSSTK